MLSVPLRFSALEAVPRRGEPVTVGLPWPRGAVKDASEFSLLDGSSTPRFLQTDVLERWPDGSIKWCLFDFLADWDGTASSFRIVQKNETVAAPAIRPGTIPAIGVLVEVEGLPPKSTEIGVEEATAKPGPIRTTIDLAELNIGGLFVRGRLEVYPTAAAMRVHITVLNPAAADHPGGNWDLGAGGSKYLKELSVILLNAIENPAILGNRERGAAWEPLPAHMIHQASSGGEHWNSQNHLDRTRKVNLDFRGFQRISDSGAVEGLRATPIAVLESEHQRLGVTMTHFWENFPKNLAVHESRIQLSLFPKQEVAHEIQGGEQKTHTFMVSFAKDDITREPLVWARSPLTVTAPPEWYAASGAIGYLTPAASDPHSQYGSLITLALEGSDTFLHKREKIDEYGWRHFGDIYGDHEAVYHNGPEPMVSHYNNQYDCVAGFIDQYLRSGDTRWLSQGLECADHTCDIDVYHTTQDKSAYNGGLFWHTYHYAPADTGTHRSYPRSLKNAQHFESGQDLEKLGSTGAKLKTNYAVGGGPSAAHNYNHGLMLAYFLTGNPLYRDTAIGLADFVLNMDDGTKTVFKWFSRRDTGLAIQSSAGYLGPGRASANSLLAVLAGHRLTGDAKYLRKASQIVRRVVHPAQNLERLDLLNAELRWFYTMFLQALGTYLDHKIERGELDDDYCYARLSLLHYARYMAKHERPILDQPEKLQYPTETWAAQDMRKVEVFQFAAKHAEGAERELFLERAEWFFRYVERTLDGFETKSLCRPVILMMKYGWSRAWWKQNPNAAAPKPLVEKTDYGTWTMYVPQKEVAIKRAKRIMAISMIAAIVAIVAAIVIAM